MAVNSVDNARAPGGGRIAATTRHVLPNGIVALIYSNPASPTVSVHGEVLAGAVLEPAAQAGLALFTGAALIRGAGHRSFQQIVAETEERGCSVNAGGGLHASGFSARALAEDLPLVLEILAEMLISPTFPAAEVEKLRGQLLTTLRESEQNTLTQAGQAARALLYPPDHPYSHPASGTIATVQDLTRDDLVAFHRNYHPAATTIAVVGDVDPAAVIAELERHFGGWRVAGDPPGIVLPPAPAPAGALRRAIPVAGKSQADLVWAVPGLARNSPDFYPAMVGNLILGQLGMYGRLGESVREEQGMAYYITSNLDADLGPGPWSVAAGVNPANVERTVAAILHEIEQFKRDGPDAEELADAQSYLTGSLALGLETNDGIAGVLLLIERHKLGLDHLDRYPSRIRAVTREQIVEVARRYLSTDSYVLAVAGPIA